MFLKLIHCFMTGQKTQVASPTQIGMLRKTLSKNMYFSSRRCIVNLIIRMKNITRSILILILILINIGCNTTDENNESNGSNESNESNQEVEVNRGVNNIEIERKNMLRTVGTLNILIDLTEIKGHISICTIKYEEDKEGELSRKPDYDNCIVKGALEQVKAEYSIEIGNHIDNLIATIWLIGSDLEPSVYSWNRYQDGSRVRLFSNDA